MQYNASDMITNVVHASGEKRVYVYDDLDRLLGEKHYDASESLIYNAAYAFDLAGNRTQTVINGVTNSYTLGLGNRLDTWTGGSYREWEGNQSDVLLGFGPDAFPSAPVEVNLSVSGPMMGKVEIFQQPAEDNDFTLIVTVDDRAPEGGHWYTLDIDW